jgi:glutamyl-tRNA synthetase
MGKIAQPVRVAVTGGTASPGIGVTLSILGRSKTLERLERAIAFARASGSP